MKEQPDLSELIESNFIGIRGGTICIDGICFRGNLFDEEQWRVVESLMENASAGTKWIYEKKIKELRSKHRKAVKKLKLELQEAKLFENY